MGIYNVFRNLLIKNTFVICIDDLLITVKDETEIEKLKILLQTASEYQLQLNIKKCNFLKLEIDFRGSIIITGKLHPSPLKTKVIKIFQNQNLPWIFKITCE